VFPALGVRFVALADGIDSDGDMDFLPFRSLLNDYYLKDLSKKIRSAVRTNAANGSYIGGQAPYGFIKNPDNPKYLAIDGYASVIVLKIFNLRLQNLSYCKIAAELNNNGILAPRDYYYQRTNKHSTLNEHNVWVAATIRAILHNEAYIGHSVRLKSGTISHKNHRKVIKPKDQWVRRENTHPAIISQELWDAVRSINSEKDHGVDKTKRKVVPFLGLLRCSDCGSKFVHATVNRRTKTGQDVSYRSYTCCLYVHTGRSKCSPHPISEMTLMKIIREDIRKHMPAGEDSLINGTLNKLHDEEEMNAKRKIDGIDARLAGLESSYFKLYDDKLNGVINNEEFQKNVAGIEKKREQKKEERDKLIKKIDGAKLRSAQRKNWHNEIKSFLMLEHPTNETLSALIDKIVIGAAERALGDKRKSVHIYYRFDGNVSD